ncbi:histidine kinase [Dactylosporangium sp. AC04546]|uniref:sensor histidine kinase n=1 Tax=Dactylosporangium sp. AC04546 TaxID=2862460 RepID=UPI001EDE14BA|nr:ATP-binding protein [Dactylosporangium sp. AC04546]WVK78562.1 histidine kinase [Dactylosporangium sp. AC04546]
MADRRWPTAAWAVLALTGAATCAAAAGWALAAPGWAPWTLYWLVDLMVGALYGFVGWLMLARGGQAAAAWVVAAIGLSGALSAAVVSWSMIGAWPGPMPADRVLGAMYWLSVPGYHALTVVLPWLLPARPFVPADRLALGAGVVFVVAVQLCTMAGPDWSLSPLPIADPGLLALRALVARWLYPVWLLLTVVAAAGVLWRRHQAPPAGRAGLNWLAVGSILLALAILPPTLGPALGVPVPVPLAPALMLAAQAFFPAAVLVVVLRQRLWGTELAVRRTLVWGLMTGGVIGAYTMVVLVLNVAVPRPSILPEVLATAMLAAAFQPVRQWVQVRVDRLVHGEAGQPLIRQVADGLRDVDRGQQMLAAVAQGIARSLRLEAVTVTTGAAPAPIAPGPAGEPLTVPLVSDDREVGVLRAWPRAGERLGRRAALVLTDLAPMVTALVELAAAQDEVDRARDEAARARDEERRRLRRDLHDGLGPALSGLGLGLAAARNLLRDHRRQPGVDRADALLVQLSAEAERQAVAVRDLAHDLLPPLLDDGALRPALDQLRERYHAAGLRVEVHGPPVRLAPAIATAVYGIVAEAVRNVHRHASTDRCMIDVMNGRDALEVSVVDHGAGIDPGSVAGVGTRSMRERAQSIGGRLSIGPAGASGTRVRLVVPRASVAVRPAVAGGADRAAHP